MAFKFELGREFCTMHLAAKFHHPTFNRSEVIVLTSKQQTDSGESAANQRPLVAIVNAKDLHRGTAAQGIMG